MNYTDKLYSEARMAAVLAHSGKRYANIFPYEKHLDDVVAVLTRFGFSGKYKCGGYLHDSIEDGGLSYDKIKRHFGVEVAEIVWGCTDELGRTRKEKKIKTLPKTRSIPDCIPAKLADRIANFEQGGKVEMYVEEHQEFKGALFDVTPKDALPMWDHLDFLIQQHHSSK